MKEPSSEHDNGGVAPPPLEEPPTKEYPPMEGDAPPMEEGTPAEEFAPEQIPFGARDVDCDRDESNYPLRLVRKGDSIEVLHVSIHQS